MLPPPNAYGSNLSLHPYSFPPAHLHLHTFPSRLSRRRTSFSRQRGSPSLTQAVARTSSGLPSKLRKGTPLASRVAQGVSGPSTSCVWNPRVFADDARAQSYLTLCDPMNGSTPGLSVHHQPPEISQTHWDPDSLRPALRLGGQATAGERSPGRSLCLTKSSARRESE